MSYPIEPRPPERLYVPSWWAKRWPWLLDALSLLDLDPLWRRCAPLGRPFEILAERLVLPLAAVLDWVARPLRSIGGRLDAAAGAVASRLPLPRPLREILWLGPVTPNHPLEHDAHAVLKRQYKDVRRWSLIAAVTLHGSVFALWPAMEVDDYSSVGEALEAVELIPEIEIPKPPAPLARPATPVMAATAIDEDVTIAPTTFEENPVEALPPPPVEEATLGRSEEPFFTPYTVAPSILNVREIQRALVAEYPSLLRNAGIGGRVVVWFFVNVEGRVERTRIANSSGHKELDAAALRVADLFRFSPALNRDQKTAVWVQFPMDFTVR